MSIIYFKDIDDRERRKEELMRSIIMDLREMHDALRSLREVIGKCGDDL